MHDSQMEAYIPTADNIRAHLSQGYQTDTCLLKPAGHFSKNFFALKILKPHTRTVDANPLIPLFSLCYWRHAQKNTQPCDDNTNDPLTLFIITSPSITHSITHSMKQSHLSNTLLC